MEWPMNYMDENIDDGRSMMNIKVQGNSIALTTAIVRWEESQNLEGERIFYDPYPRFHQLDHIEIGARNPDEAKPLR